MFHILFVYLLLYVPYMQKFKKKKKCMPAKLLLVDLFWKFHIYHYCLKWHSTIMEYIKFQVLKLI